MCCSVRLPGEGCWFNSSLHVSGSPLPPTTTTTDQKHTSWVDWRVTIATSVCVCVCVQTQNLELATRRRLHQA